MLDRKELKRRGKLASRTNMWPCLLAGLLMALLVEFSASFGGSGVLTAMMSSTASQQEISTEAETATEIQENSAAEAASESEETTEIAASDTQEEEVVYTQKDYMIYYAMQQGLMFLGGHLPGALGAFLNLMIRGNGMIAMLVVLLVSNVLEVGCDHFFVLNTQKKTYVNEIFYPFKKGRYWRIMMIQLYRMCYTLCWSMLLIVPGVIKALEYRCVPYLIAENQELKLEEAFAKSKELMKGHKKEAFLLDLSFIGWDLLGLLTMGLSTVFFSNPYKYASRAEFYVALRGPLEPQKGRRTYDKTPVPGKKSQFDSFNKYQKKIK